ncbi:MAG TPA: hypothetical protein VHA12_02195 [Candidatus Nanoarchaeia archaeon]|nr:hypothetical protein [Candidatus Nanoarchaeia archaeon]
MDSKDKRTLVYRIELSRKNEDYEARASCPEGSAVKGFIEASTLHGLASKVSESWRLDNYSVDYSTIEKPQFDPRTDVSRDAVTGIEIKKFHYWLMQHLQRST